MTMKVDLTLPDDLETHPWADAIITIKLSSHILRIRRTW